jgi:hypothetical protein
MNIKFKAGDFAKSEYLYTEDLYVQVISHKKNGGFVALVLHVINNISSIAIGYEYGFMPSYFTLITDPNELKICEDALLKINKLRVFS